MASEERLTGAVRMIVPTDRHQLVLMASPPRVGYPPAERGQIVSGGEDGLYLDCAGGDLRGTIVVQHYSGHPGPLNAPEGTTGEPDAMRELVWQINSGHLIVDNYDLGFEVVPDLGLTPGLWQVRAAVWGREPAADLEEQWDERLLTDPDAEDPALVETPLSPEIWLVQLWPARPNGALSK